jgi:hypothetical protein
MKSQRWAPPKNLWVDEKSEVGTPLGRCRFQKISNSNGANGKKAWQTLSFIYSINPRGCQPLATTFLGQAVDPGMAQGLKIWVGK